MKIILKVDSRSKDFHFSKHFGNVSEFPTEFLIKDVVPDVVQPTGNVECTCISICDIADDKNDVIYDYDDLYNRIPHSMFGASPQDALGEACKGGLLQVGLPVRVNPFTGYFSAHTGTMSPYDNTKSAFLLSNEKIIIYCNWYSDWGTSDVMPIGDNAVSGHMFCLDGWTLVNGVEMFRVSSWIGKKLYMPKETFENAVSKLGCGTAVLSTVQIDAVRSKTLAETIIDMLKNVVLLYKQLIMLKTTPQPTPNTPPNAPQAQNPIVPVQNDTLATVANFCSAIGVYEGLAFNPKTGKPDLNHINRNPGNCVWSLVGYDPKYGNVTRNGRFAVFPTWDLGMLYLENTVKQKAFQHPTWTIYDYFALFHAPASDNNSPENYSNWVAEQIGVKNNYLLKDLT